MDPLDGEVSGQIEWFLHVAFGTLSVFAVIMYSIPNFIVMVVPVTVLNLHMQVILYCRIMTKVNKQ